MVDGCGRELFGIGAGSVERSEQGQGWAAEGILDEGRPPIGQELGQIRCLTATTSTGTVASVGWSSGGHAWLMSAARCVAPSVMSSAFAGFRFRGDDHLGGALVFAFRALPP
jgi:hypothetical protein